MTCHESTDGRIHVCAPQGYRFAHAGTCPDCGKRTRFIGTYYEWYGPDETCLRCGRSWADGEWMPLDFIRQSRKRSIDAAKQSFRRAINACPVLS